METRYSPNHVGYQEMGTKELRSTFLVESLFAPEKLQLIGKEIEVRFQKRAHNPLLLAASFDKTDLPIPWLDNKHLRLVFG